MHCTHNRWWLVLGWVTTKEDHPRLRFIAPLLLTYAQKNLTDHFFSVWRVQCRINRYAKYAMVGAPDVGGPPAVSWKNFHCRVNLVHSHRLPYCNYADCTYESSIRPRNRRTFFIGIDAYHTDLQSSHCRSVWDTSLSTRADTVKTRAEYGDQNSIAGY